jgi:hypothetical protein
MNGVRMKNVIAAVAALLTIVISLDAGAKEREGLNVAQDMGILCEASVRVAEADEGKPYKPKSESDEMMMSTACLYYVGGVLDVSSASLDPRFSSIYLIGGKWVRIRLKENAGLMDVVKAFIKYVAAHPERAVQEEKADVIIIKAMLYSKLASAVPIGAKSKAALAPTPAVDHMRSTKPGISAVRQVFQGSHPH